MVSNAYNVELAISEALEKAILIVEEDGWTVEKQEGEVVIKSKVGDHGRKIWLLVATVNIAPEILETRLMDIDNLTKWNTTVTESRKIKTLSSNCFITHKVTAEGAGGLVSARDFVYGAKHVTRNGKFIIGGLSVDCDEAPGPGGRVRAVHGPSCQVIEAAGPGRRSRYTWLMDCDYRGMMPVRIINIAMPVAQMRMVECINSLVRVTPFSQ